MNNRIYDLLKWTAIIILPATSTFVVSLGIIWSIPYTDQVSQTITALSLLLGAALGVSHVKYTNATSDYKPRH